jgi:transaldolase
MVKEGVKLHNMFNPIANNVYIKIPVSPALKEDDETMFDGIKAIKTLSNKKIRVNTTLIFTPEQALLAAKAGAKFVSPFVGREDDYLRKMAKIKFEKRDYFPQEGIIVKGKKLRDEGIVSGIDLIKEIRQIFDNYNIKTEILAASIRNEISVWEAAAVGSDIVTISMDTMKKLLYHKKTSEGMKKSTIDIVPEYKELVRGK